MKPAVVTVTLALLSAQVAVVGVGAHVYAWYTNSLEGSGRWIASKDRLERRVMGSSAFATSHHTLAEQRLDLGRWFGFQEVLLAEPVAARAVAFDFQPAPGSYLAFLYALGPEGAAGLRLSAAERFPSGRFRLDAEGAFLDFEPLPELSVVGGAWSHLALEFGPEGARAALDGAAPLPIAAAPERQRFGFRSGLEPVLIDDVEVRCDGAGGFHETFFNAAGFALGLSVLAGVLVLDLGVWRLVRRHGLSGRRTVALALGGAVSCLAAALGAFLLQGAWAGRYPRVDRAAEAAWLQQEIDEVTRRIDAEHGKSEPGRTRVLVVGTSQTWGAGATRADQGFVEVLGRLLAAREPERLWECINAGIQGLRAPRLLELFRERWLALEPDVLVVNLSNNDKDAEAFARALHGFADLAEEHGITLLFALEPNSIEMPGGGPAMHATMRRVAEALSVPVVDLHAALAAEVERGFLWWDPVHPTTLGHRLIAETLLPAVLALAQTP